MRSEVLDHGYVDLVEAWGNDERIIEAARMSTNKGFLGWEPEVQYTCAECTYIRETHNPVDENVFCPNGHGTMKYQLIHHGDEKLLAYLYEHNHHTPFEMAGMIVEVQAPIFVFREWHRHRTQSYNELSARYTPLPDVNYLPTVERVLQREIKNKQAMGINDTMDAAGAALFLVHLTRQYEQAEREYQDALASGVPKELARLCIPVGRYSRMRASANLRNWLHFLTLRMDLHAQWEIRQYAFAVAKLVAAKFPRTWKLFVDDSAK